MLTKSCQWFDVQILVHDSQLCGVAAEQEGCVCIVHVRMCIVKLSEFTMRSEPKRPMSAKLEIEEK